MPSGAARETDLPPAGAAGAAPAAAGTDGFTLAAHRPQPIPLHHLELQHFRNLCPLQLELEGPRLLVIGSNGQGKSNLLEAVELLGSLRSHRCSSDRDLIRHGQSSSRLSARSSEGDLLQLELRRQGGRSAWRNGKALERQLDLIGPLRCVGFSSLDLELVRGEPSLRRQWLDRVVLQLEPLYADLLSRYGRLLRQRSHLLRQGRGERQTEGLLEAFDLQMALFGTRIHRRRRRALERLAPLARQWHGRLSGGLEDLQLGYSPGSRLEGDEDEARWRDALQQQLVDQRAAELRTGQCQVGPQRDDVDLRLGESLARRYGSAGQQRTLVLALKLAELDLVGQIWQQPPLLLLDDVLAELDPRRQDWLLSSVGGDHQCLVSATHLGAFDGGWLHRAQVVEIEAGRVQPRASAA